jgi:hypothetical protein
MRWDPPKNKDRDSSTERISIHETLLGDQFQSSRSNSPPRSDFKRSPTHVGYFDVLPWSAPLMNSKGFLLWKIRGKNDSQFFILNTSFSFSDYTIAHLARPKYAISFFFRSSRFSSANFKDRKNCDQLCHPEVLIGFLSRYFERMHIFLFPSHSKPLLLECKSWKSTTSSEAEYNGACASGCGMHSSWL